MKCILQSVIWLTCATLVTPNAIAQSNVLTQDYDISRSGANLSEVVLAPSNVSSAKFGKLFAYPVDEEVFAQPLYVHQLSIAGGTHNVVFVATTGNSVYAFDADNPATANKPLWSVNLGTAVPPSKFLFDGGGGLSHDGIYSTPVIDPSSHTIYLVTHLWNTSNQSVSLHLHALDATTGNEKFGGPVQISTPSFDPAVNLQRAGLLLLNGTVYVAIASHGDFHLNLATLKQEPYVGLVLAYDAQTLALVASFNAEAGGMGAGIWHGGRGLASDGTYIYAMTANAFTVGGADYSESFVQLHPGTLAVAGYYQDPDSACLNTLDLDLSSSGPQVIPGAGTNLLIGGGKEGKVYVLQLNKALHTQTPQYFWGTSNYPALPAEGGTCVDTRGIHGYLQGSDTAFWSNPGGASYYYSFGNYDQLRSWQVSGNTFTQTSADTPPSLRPNALAVSANGGANGILWTVARQATGPAIFSAYNAIPSGGHLALLWNSAQVPKRDALGILGRYSVPTVANGKVYVGSGSNQVAAYGLLPTTPSVLVTPTSATVQFIELNASTQAIFVNSIGGYTGTVSLTLTGLPSGVTYSFSKPTVTLTAGATVQTGLTITPSGAVLPLNDNYTALIHATPSSGITSYAPLRLIMRNANFTSVTKVGCNSSNAMSASLSWQIDGSSVPSLWIQDPTTPTFPGRPWIDPAPATGMAQTSYSTTSNKQNFLYWAIDQSAGIPANLDNALKFVNLRTLYSCP